MSLTKLDRERYVLGDAADHIGFLNCERISERSHIHGWTVEPHYHEGLAQLFVFAEGQVEGLIETRTRQIDCPAIVWLPALCNHAFKYPENMQGWVLTIPTTDVRHLTDRTGWMAAWIDTPQVLQGRAFHNRLQEAVEIAKRIEAENKFRDETRNTVLEAQFLLLMSHLHRGLMFQAGSGEPVSDRRTELARNFQNCLDQHMPDNRSVTEYADMLSVTPTHLSRVVKSVTGRTPVEIIQGRILLEAKRKLAFTDLSIAEIAFTLQFSTPSYFARFFSSQTNETPKNFRQRYRENAR